MVTMDILTQEERAKVEATVSGRRGGEIGELSQALLDGAMVFLPGGTATTVKGLRNRKSALHARGYGVRQRSGNRNGVAGLFVWAVLLRTDEVQISPPVFEKG